MTTRLQFCGTCGCPAKGSLCEMCFSPVSEASYHTGRATAPPPSGPRPEDFPELEAAFRAWKVKNHEEMVELTLARLGIRTPAQDAPRGVRGWTTTLDSAAIYISLVPGSDHILVESPIVWVPQHQRVPLMRTLLELNSSLGSPACFAVRGSVVLLRFTDNVHNVSPPKLLSAIREVAQLADAHDNWLAEVFGCTMIGPVAIANNQPWKYLGRQTVLAGLADARPLGDMHSEQPETYRDVLGQALALIDRYDPQSATATSGMIVRAAVNIIRLRFGDTSPTAVSMLLHRTGALTQSPGQEKATEELTDALRRFLQLDLQLDRLAPAPLPPVTPLKEPIRAYVSQVLEKLRRLPKQEDVLRQLLAGLASELVLRAPLRGSVVQGLRDAVTHGGSEELYKAVVGAAR